MRSARKSWLKRLFGGGPRASRPQRRREPLWVEQLEDRLAPAGATLTVNTDADNDMRDTVLTLREAIMVANGDLAKNALTAQEQAQVQGIPGGGSENQDTIKFDIGGNAPATITVDDNPLPDIKDSVIIDAATKPAGEPNQTIRLLGNDPGLKANHNANGLTFTKTGAPDFDSSSHSKVWGLKIEKFEVAGILVNNVDFIEIGGTGANQGNTIIENKTGVHITSVNAKHNLVIANFIGTDSSSAANIGNTDVGIRIDNGASFNTIGGLDAAERNIISGNTGAGVAIQDADDNTVLGNYIGTKVNGTAALPGQHDGVFIGGDSDNNKIGGIVPTQNGVIVTPANVISGNFDGVVISGVAATDNQVQGNFIGVDKNGTAALPNTDVGVALSNTTGNLIGGPVAGAANVVSKNANDGISVGNNSQGNLIQNNNVGTGKDPSDKNVKLGNGRYGIYFDATSFGNTVTPTVKGNKIAYNGKDGVKDDSKANKIVDPNLIWENGELGIDIGPDGVTTDQMPVLTSATVSGLTTQVIGSLTAAASSEYVLEFFGNVTADPSGHGEGEAFLGSTTVTTDAAGFVSFNVTLDAVYGNYVTATATGTAANGYTSEFAANVTVSGGSSTAAVGNFVFGDLNQNGLQDPGESGLANVAVTLTPLGGGLSQATLTLPGGLYSFTNLQPGDYYLTFTPPSGYAFTQPYQGDATLDSDADPASGQTAVFTLIAGEYNPTLDAGLVLSAPPPDPEGGTQTATLSGRAWRDADADGVRDAGELGLAGVIVYLLDSKHKVVAKTFTGQDGTYIFKGVAEGSYAVRFEQPAMKDYSSFSPKGQGGDTARDSDVNADGLTAFFTLLGGMDKDDLDAGLVPLL